LHQELVQRLAEVQAWANAEQALAEADGHQIVAAGMTRRPPSRRAAGRAEASSTGRVLETTALEAEGATAEEADGNETTAFEAEGGTAEEAEGNATTAFEVAGDTADEADVNETIAFEAEGDAAEDAEVEDASYTTPDGYTIVMYSV
jgi:hypothetical protein